MTGRRRGGPQVRLAELALAPLVTVPAQATIREVAGSMMRTGVSAVVVGRSDAIVTERDIVHAVGHGRTPDDPVVLVATVHPLAIRSSESVLDALAAMMRHSVRHLVVLDRSDEPVGVVGLTDVVQVVLGGSDVPHWLTALRLALGRPDGP
jgi:signal-transduction protein with cAMP-binding, CBS, and nucleotidyltransferase domain